MKLYLAGSGWPEKIWIPENYFDFYRLESFYAISGTERKHLHKYKSFMLDSGAFAFFGNKKVDWNSYTTSYIDFINKYDVKLFFELDIYKVIGTEATIKLRERIEQETGKKCIPVFHSRLGIQTWKDWCEKYDYVAISASGLYESKWTRKNPEQLRKMILYARQRGVDVHGLGYTKLDTLHEMPFTSVDSTSWLSGNRFGAVYFFKGTTVVKTDKPEGTRVKTNMTARHNFYEWVKYQKYLDKHLR